MMLDARKASRAPALSHDLCRLVLPGKPALTSHLLRRHVYIHGAILSA